MRFSTNNMRDESNKPKRTATNLFGHGKEPKKQKKKSAPRQFEMAKITVRWWLSWWWTYNLLIKIFYVAAGQAKKREEGMRLFCASSFTEPVVQFRNFRSNRIFGPVNMTAVQKKTTESNFSNLSRRDRSRHQLVLWVHEPSFGHF